MNPSIPIAVAAMLSAVPALTRAQDASSIAADAQRRADAIAAATPAAPWGCTVLLCLANPEGPTAVAQCVDPIRRLWRELRAGGAFPQCPMAQGPNGGAYAEMGRNYYDRCPDGMTELPQGALATAQTILSAAPSQAASRSTAPTPSSQDPATAEPVVLRGIGSGAELQPGAPDSAMPPKVCAGQLIGTLRLENGDTDESAGIYDRITLVPPSATSAYIDVMVDRGDGNGYRMWQRVRY